jgi:nitroreductase
MSDIMDSIRRRRSVRKYKKQDLPEDLLNDLLEAVRWSPSWANTQCWEVIVVKDPETKKSLQETLPKGNPAFSAIEDAPIILALCGKLMSSGYYKGAAATKFGDWFMFDLGIATQSLCIAAHSMGLGTVIVGLFDHDKAMRTLSVPEGFELSVLIPVGYPEKTPSAPKRKGIKEFVHHNLF